MCGYAPRSRQRWSSRWRSGLPLWRCCGSCSIRCSPRRTPRPRPGPSRSLNACWRIRLPSWIGRCSPPTRAPPSCRSSTAAGRCCCPPRGHPPHRSALSAPVRGTCCRWVPWTTRRTAVTTASPPRVSAGRTGRSPCSSGQDPIDATLATVAALLALGLPVLVLVAGGRHLHSGRSFPATGGAHAHPGGHDHQR